MRYRCKVTVSVSAVSEHRTSGELRYYHQVQYGAQRLSTTWKVHFVANITFYLDKLLGAELIGDRRVGLPDYIRNNRYVVGIDKSNRQVFKDNLCFFKCLLMRLDCLCDLGNTNEVGRRQIRCRCRIQEVKNRHMLRVYEQFRHHTRPEVSAGDFGGVSYNELVCAEGCFNLRVTILALQVDCVWLNAEAGAPVAQSCFLTSTRNTLV